MSAICYGHPEPLWDDRVDGETPEQRGARHDRAAAICGRCPSRAACLQEAVDEGYEGIWGGVLMLSAGRVAVMPDPCLDCHRPMLRRSTGRPRQIPAGHVVHAAHGRCDSCYERHRRPARGRQRQARCGTYSGYKTHKRLREQACADCVDARRDYERSREQRPA